MASGGTIVDINLSVSPIGNHAFLGVSGSVTAKGYFVNALGMRTGASFTNAITGAGGTPTMPSDLFGAAIPTDAIGMRVNLSANIYWDVSPEAVASGDFHTNFARYPVAIADPQYNVFGRA